MCDDPAMSDASRPTEHRASAPSAESHGPADDGQTHGHDDHAHAGEVLGPVDVVAWGSGVLGVAIGLAIAWAFVLATAG